MKLEIHEYRNGFEVINAATQEIISQVYTQDEVNRLIDNLDAISVTAYSHIHS